MSRREIAFLIARMFPTRVPSAAEVLREFPWMDRATAYRYVHDYKTAWVMAAKRAA